MLEWLNDIDTQWFLWINQHHCDFADWLFWTSSQHWSWAVVLVAFFCATTLRLEPRRWWAVGLGIALCFLLSDRISVMCFKDVVCRLRPCHVIENVRMFRTHCGGQYGFISSHAANVFSLAMFLALRYGKKTMRRNDGSAAPRKKAWLIPLLSFLWAFMVIYSRPYLGKHYPGDVICGAIVGLAIGSIIYYVLEKIPQTKFSPRD